MESRSTNTKRIQNIAVVMPSSCRQMYGIAIFIYILLDTGPKEPSIPIESPRMYPLLVHLIQIGVDRIFELCPSCRRPSFARIAPFSLPDPPLPRCLHLLGGRGMRDDEVHKSTLPKRETDLTRSPSWITHQPKLVVTPATHHIVSQSRIMARTRSPSTTSVSNRRP